MSAKSADSSDGASLIAARCAHGAFCGVGAADAFALALASDGRRDPARGLAADHRLVLQLVVDVRVELGVADRGHGEVELLPALREAVVDVPRAGVVAHFDAHARGVVARGNGRGRVHLADQIAVLAGTRADLQRHFLERVHRRARGRALAHDLAAARAARTERRPHDLAEVDARFRRRRARVVDRHAGEVLHLDAAGRAFAHLQRDLRALAHARERRGILADDVVARHVVVGDVRRLVELQLEAVEVEARRCAATRSADRASGRSSRRC